MSDADVSLASMEQLRVALSQTRRDVELQVDAASRALDSVVSSTQQELRSREAELQRAQARLAEAVAALRACQAQRDANCSGPAAAVQRCQAEERQADQRVQACRSALTSLREVAAKHREACTRLRQRLTDASGRGLADLARLTASIRRYRSIGTPSSSILQSHAPGGGQQGGQSSAIGVSGATTGPSVEDVAIDAVMADDPGPYEKVSESDMRWGLVALDEVVAPGVRAGSGREDFAARDAREDRRGDRTYAQVYDAFYTQTRGIKVSQRADGAYDLVNGHHRLALARRLGIRTLPMFVRRG